jgi:single-stranded-DNA-specific exonuclease
MKSNWNITSDPELPLLNQIMQTRKLTEQDLHKTLDDLPNEELLLNISQVAERIRDALYKNEPMIIFGHDDPDGITSAYILYRYLETLGYQKHHYYIPNRNFENHGIQKSFLEFVKKGKYPLVITVDNGISALEGIASLNELGCEVLVTDHHLVQQDQIPDAYAILNPQLPDSEYPYRMLAGVGVVLMLIRYLSKLLEHPLEPALYFWAAIGSIADKVPMTGVNRLIVRHVINNWDTIKDYTIDFLLRNYNRVSSVTDKLGFMQYCCRLIANGREENGQHVAMRFLLQLSDEKVRLFQLLEEEKNGWETALNNVFKLVDTLLEDYDGDAFVYYDDEDLIPFSLLGTAATYIVNNLNVPTILLKNRQNVMVCEGRCNSKFNMVDAFTYCKGSLIQFGGHAKAAGFTMAPEKYDEFLDLFHTFLKAQHDIMKQAHNLNIDAVTVCNELNNKTWHELDILMPYGQENPEPVIVATDCNITHLAERFSLDNNGIQIPDEGHWDIALKLKSASLLKLLDIHPMQGAIDNL